MEMKAVSTEKDSPRDEKTFPWIRMRYMTGEESRRQKSVEERSK
jgi:hypothetical protein